MTDQTVTPAAPAAVSAGEPANAQMVVALRIVYALGLIGLALIIAGVVCLLQGKTENAIWLAIGGIVGSLGSSLNAPTGVSNALKASAVAKGDGQ